MEITIYPKLTSKEDFEKWGKKRKNMVIYKK